MKSLEFWPDLFGATLSLRSTVGHCARDYQITTTNYVLLLQVVVLLLQESGGCGTHTTQRLGRALLWRRMSIIKEIIAWILNMVHIQGVPQSHKFHNNCLAY